MEQRSNEWFEARKNRVTGSVIGAIIGLSPFMKKNDVMRSMVRAHHGAESEFQGNIATNYGTVHEPMATMDFELETGKKVEEVGFFVHPEHDWLGASPDGFVGDDAVIEIKCPYGKRNGGEFKSIHEQPHYYAQVQYEMFCTGRTKTHFYQWSEHGTQLETIEFSQVYIEETLPALKAFHDEFLEQCKSPDKHLAPLVQHKEAKAVEEAYAKAKADFDAAKEALEQAKVKMLEVADGNKCTIGDYLVYPVNKKGSISYAKVVKEHCKDIDLEPYRGKPTTSWVIK